MDTSSLADTIIAWNRPGNSRPVAGYLKPLFPRVWLRDAPNLTTILTQLDNRLEQGRTWLDILRAAHLIGLAVGTDLDDLGAIPGVVRFSGEADDQYRLRLPATIQHGVSASTIPDMRTFLSLSLGVPVSVTDVSPGVFKVILLAAISNTSVVKPLVNQVKAAGTQYTASMLIQPPNAKAPLLGQFLLGGAALGTSGVYQAIT